MEVIPVIDVRLGTAVHAVAGERARYQPLVSPLVEGSEPVAVARAYRRLYPFKTLYVADLDGIEGRGAARALHAGIAAAWGQGEVWIDDGAAAVESLPSAPSAARRVPVLGSESLAARDLGGRIGAAAAQGRGHDEGVLSLDFRGPTFLGPAGLIDDPSSWPRRVIVMTLARVGSGTGPDVDRVREIAERAGRWRQVYAAGGVRDTRDCRALHDAGAAGVLIATALHNGQIKAGDLEEIAGFNSFSPRDEWG